MYKLQKLAYTSIYSNRSCNSESALSCIIYNASALSTDKHFIALSVQSLHENHVAYI